MNVDTISKAGLVQNLLRVDAGFRQDNSRVTEPAAQDDTTVARCLVNLQLTAIFAVLSRLDQDRSFITPNFQISGQEGERYRSQPGAWPEPFAAGVHL